MNSKMQLSDAWVCANISAAPWLSMSGMGRATCASQARSLLSTAALSHGKKTSCGYVHQIQQTFRQMYLFARRTTLGGASCCHHPCAIQRREPGPVACPPSSGHPPHNHNTKQVRLDLTCLQQRLPPMMHHSNNMADKLKSSMKRCAHRSILCAHSTRLSGPDECVTNINCRHNSHRQS